MVLTGGLVVLGISNSLATMIRIGQRRLTEMFQALSALISLKCRRYPDIIPGLYNSRLAGVLRGCSVTVTFDNHETGIERNWQAGEHHCTHTRK